GRGVWLGVIMAVAFTCVLTCRGWRGPRSGTSVWLWFIEPPALSFVFTCMMCPSVLSGLVVVCHEGACLPRLLPGASLDPQTMPSQSPTHSPTASGGDDRRPQQSKPDPKLIFC